MLKRFWSFIYNSGGASKSDRTKGVDFSKKVQGILRLFSLNFPFKGSLYMAF